MFRRYLTLLKFIPSNIIQEASEINQKYFKDFLYKNKQFYIFPVLEFLIFLAIRELNYL